MKVILFISAVSGLFLKLIYHGDGMVVHLLLLKFSVVRYNTTVGTSSVLKVRKIKRFKSLIIDSLQHGIRHRL